MIKNATFSFLFFCASIYSPISTNEEAHFEQSDPITDISHFSELALQIAKPSNKRDKQLYSNLVNQYVALTPDLGQYMKLESAIAAFLQKALQLNLDNISIIDSKTTALHGNSQDEVFFSRNQEGHLDYVVKAFRDPASPKSRFLPEMAATALIKANECQHFSTIEILGSAKCKAQDASFGLLLETAAPGLRLDQYAYAIGALDNHDPDRKLKKQEALEACFASGAGLASFHQIETGATSFLSQEDAHRIYKKLAMLRSPSKAWLREMIDLKALEAYAERTVRQALETPFKTGYQHGAAHVRNIFYHVAEKRLTFIDNGHLIKSFKDEWDPVGDPALDVVRLKESLFNKGFLRLSQAEMLELMLAIDKGYESQGKLPDQRLLKFYMLDRKLSRLSEKDKEEKDPELRAIFDESLHYFLQELMSDV